MLIIILVVISIFNGFSDELPTVAIMQFEASGMSETDAANITSRFSYELSRVNRFRITEREMMEQILQEQQFQLSGCTSSECVVEVGQLLSVQYMIAGEITKTFDLYSLLVRLISVESGEIIAQVIEDYEGEAKDFITISVRNAALKLAAESGIKSTSNLIGNATMASSSGQVNFTLNISPVNVYIDGIYSGENISKIVNLSLPMGDHKIKFTANGYQDYEKMITIIRDQSIDYTVDMQRGASGTTNQITTGIIVVRSVPEGATVYLDGRNVGVTPHQVPKVGAGKHTVRVVKSLYHDYMEEITLQADGITQIMAQLKPAFGSLEIITIPAGGVVMLNGQMKGRTPLKLNTLASGEYEIVITKDLYHPYTEKFIITDDSQNRRNINLIPAFGTLNVTGSPDGAAVYLDGQLRGQTPVKIDELPSGAYNLCIDKDLYAPYETAITIEDGKTSEQSYILEPRFGTVNINGTPAGATVTINGQKAGTLPLKLYKVPAGLAEINLDAPNYHSKTQFQQVNAGDLINLEINMERHTGTIVIMTTPPGATIRLNDKGYGGSPQILKDMPAGTYQLALTHTDYLPVKVSFDLSLNERKEFNIKLMTYQGSIQQEIDGMMRIRNINALTAGSLGIIAGIIKIISVSAYHHYENATESDQAVDYYNTANSMNKLSGYMGAAAIVGAIPILKWQVDINQLKLKLK